jgi:hypothetical protein
MAEVRKDIQRCCGQYQYSKRRTRSSVFVFPFGADTNISLKGSILDILAVLKLSVLLPIIAPVSLKLPPFWSRFRNCFSLGLSSSLLFQTMSGFLRQLLKLFLFLLRPFSCKPQAFPSSYVLHLVLTLVSAPPPSNAGVPGLQPPFATFVLLPTSLFL